MSDPVTPDPTQVDVAELRALLGDGRCLCSHASTNWDGVAALLDEVETLRAKVAAVYEVVADQGGRCLNPKCETPACLLIGAVCDALEQTP